MLRARLAEPWTLASLAQEVHLSRSQLARCFGATVGVSPMTYLRQIRVERMARKLACTDATVGVSPMAYLRHMRGELIARLLVSTYVSVAEAAPVGRLD